MCYNTRGFPSDKSIISDGKTSCNQKGERGLFIMSKEHMTEREAEEYGLYYEEALALYQRYRNDPFELLAAAYEMGFLKGKQAKEAVA